VTDIASELGMAELLASFSLATDLGNGFPLEKALRNTLVAVRLAEHAGLEGQTLSDAFYVAMLRYIGCTALDYEMGSAFGDAIAARNLFASLDMGQRSRALPRVVRGLGRGESPARRAAIVGHFLRGGKGAGDRMVSVDCEVVVRMANRLRLGPGVAGALGQMFERWDGKGLPVGVAGDALEPVARVVHVAHAAEIHHRLSGVDGACRFLEAGAGGWFDPRMVSIFVDHAVELLAATGAESVWDAALAAEPTPRRYLPADHLDELTTALADFVDLKSPWMLGHSSRVAELAAGAAGSMGMSADAVAGLRHAGRIHDLGRVSVPNSVWDKPGALTSADWERVRLHPYYSERVLAGSAVLAPFGRLAGLHHERLDAGGYHRGVGAGQLPAPARLLAAADCFAALTEARAHRPARTPAEAARELGADVSAGRLDRDAVAAICDTAGEAVRVPTAWPAGLSDREVEVLRLMARGQTDKNIAAALHISASTVHTHVLHVYDKIGVRSRAAAALFAMEHHLLGSEIH
jgi:HD-GYP domain-containing protein (c-di-GMP phosphodiesterase class II)/DNA-binding CsgD family transcriptional regulator